MTPTTEELVAELRAASNILREADHKQYQSTIRTSDQPSLLLLHALMMSRAAEALTPKVGDRETVARIVFLASGKRETLWSVNGEGPRWEAEVRADRAEAYRVADAILARLTTPAEARLREALAGAFVTTISLGNPDPEERFANVTLEFRGPDALERANDLYDALATIARRALSDGMEGGGS